MSFESFFSHSEGEKMKQPAARTIGADEVVHNVSIHLCSSRCCDCPELTSLTRPRPIVSEESVYSSLIPEPLTHMKGIVKWLSLLFAGHVFLDSISPCGPSAGQLTEISPQLLSLALREA